jgi:flagellar basal-body rod protein FlgB
VFTRHTHAEQFPALGTNSAYVSRNHCVASINMPVDVNKVFGTLERALSLRAARTEVLAYNIANADTPGYKARDFDFAKAMREDDASTVALRRTDARHVSNGPVGGVELGYRVPLQPSLDQNTVETHIEQAQFADNSIRYQAILRLFSGKINHLRTAITGN